MILSNNSLEIFVDSQEPHTEICLFFLNKKKVEDTRKINNIK